MDFALPEGTREVVGVYVNGVPQREGSDFEQRGDLIRFGRPLRPVPRLGALAKLAIALCATVEPAGDSVDAIVLREGGPESVSLDRAAPSPAK